MISRYKRYLRELFRKSWVRIIGFAALALLAAAMARVLSPFLPEGLAERTGADAVAELLRILTSSMLAVTIFSLSIAVSAFATAAGTATPRASILLQQDRTTQNVLATFLGAFLFGLVGLIALRGRFYDASGQFIVFMFTIAVIALVVVALIGWTNHLMEFGRMSDTLDRVEKAATDAMKTRVEHPFFGGQPLHVAPPSSALAVLSDTTGYVRGIDLETLQECAADRNARLFVEALPGTFVAPGAPIILVEGCDPDDDLAHDLRSAFSIDRQRAFDDDPRFGLIVLTEIASRALSPAVNDPGTAIDILGRHVRILAGWLAPAQAEVRHDRVFVPPIAAEDLILDAFSPIARDGAGLFEVQIRLQKCLAHLRRIAPAAFAVPGQQLASRALVQAEAAGLLPAELARLRMAALQDGPTG